MRHFSLQWQVGVSQGETFDTNSNEHKNAPNPEVLIFDVTEAISTLSLQTNWKRKTCDVYERSWESELHVYVRVSGHDRHVRTWNDAHDGLELWSCWFCLCLCLCPSSVSGQGTCFPTSHFPYPHNGRVQLNIRLLNDWIQDPSILLLGIWFGIFFV